MPLMLSVNYVECRYPECHYAECRYAERRDAPKKCNNGCEVNAIFMTVSMRQCVTEMESEDVLRIFGVTPVSRFQQVRSDKEMKFCVFQLIFLALFFSGETWAWKGASLECWQCAAIPGNCECFIFEIN